MKTRIIAEVAQGYEGKPDYCDFYVRAAARAGADAVKFQIVYADDVAEPGYEHYDWYRQLEMDREVWRTVKSQSEAQNILLFTDVSGDRAMKVAEDIRPDGLKIHASNFFNRRLIQRAFEVAGRVFVSLGGVEEDEIRGLISDARDWGVGDRLTLLYGFQAEPTPVDKSNLARLRLLREQFPELEIGYLDHTPGESDDQIHVSLMAMTLGADWIEKHITISRAMEVEDYVSALEPDEFARYVEILRRLAAAMGSADMALDEAERVYRDKSVKKLIAARDLPAGHTLRADDMDFRRTPRIQQFQGFHDPARVLGRVLGRTLAAGDPILKEDLR